MNGDKWLDSAIIESIKAGGRAREQGLYHIFIQEDWKGLVVGHVLKNGGNKQDGEDLAQATLIILDRNIRFNKFKRESALKTYFLSIAKLQWLKKLRDRKPLDELKNEDYETVEVNVEESYINEEKKGYLMKALEQIGTRCKKILMLQQLDYSLEEIAQELGFSSALMAKKEAYRCRMRFRKFLKQNPHWIDLIS